MFRFSLFLLSLWVQLLPAQPLNQQICEQLLGNYLAKKGLVFQKVQCEPPLTHLWKTDSSSTKKLEIAMPQITYQKIEKKRFYRTVSLFITQVEGENIQSSKEIYQDTLSQKALKTLFSRTKPPFKGENPFLFTKFVAPSLAIIGSVGLIVSLFYVRSQ